MSFVRKSTLGEIIFKDIEHNDYMNEIFSNLIFNYSIKLLEIEDINYKDINVDHALRFADLLSKSSGYQYSDNHRVLAQKFIALLDVLYPDDERVKFYSKSVLTNIGNYRGLQLYSNNNIDVQSVSILDDIYTHFDMKYLAIPHHDNSYFFHSQKLIYNHLKDENFSYSGPTSMGKSIIMRMFIKEQISGNSNINYALLVPTKALISEISSSLIKDLNELLEQRNYVVINSAGALALKQEHNFIFVLTPERMLYLLIAYPNIRIDYLFIDEAHKISTKDDRSAFYYKVINMLSENERKPNIIFASPNIPNPDIYLDLIPNVLDKKDKMLKTTFSPVSHIQYLVDFVEEKISIYNNLLNNFEEIYDLSLTEMDATSFIQKYSDFTLNKQSLVYFNSKEKAINYALEYSSNLQPQNDERLNKLATEIESEIHSQYYLADLIRKGVAYHVGYLPIHIRENIEAYFRQNIIKIIFCTSTLVEGVNLPADNLFVLSYKNGSTTMTPVEFKNMVGRVGRIGYNLYGNIFILRTDEKQKKDKYLELISNDVPDQELSLVTELSKNQKKLIVDSLVEGDIKLRHHPKDQSEDSYSLMRKFALILLNDIMYDRKSVVYKEFESLLKDKTSIIKRNFGSINEVTIDDDINISTDQSQNLIIAINQGLKYPELIDGRVDYTNLLNFLERLEDIFNWDFYEKSTLGFRNSEGVHTKLKWYAVTLSRWMSGYGLSNIISQAIEYKEETSGSTVKYQGRIIPYDRSILHRNIVIADTLSIIDNIILFSCANYFLRFSTEYKRIHSIEEFDNDWYEYVEYGSTNPLTIFLQRNGFSRESSSYIKDYRRKYVVETEEGIKLSLALLDCTKEAVKLEVQNMKYNFPNIFAE